MKILPQNLCQFLKYIKFCHNLRVDAKPMPVAPYGIQSVPMKSCAKSPDFVQKRECKSRIDGLRFGTHTTQKNNQSLTQT